ncbi:MAG: hypothetical protein V1722_04635 [Candidatus Micrarchaeota archaeon]
MGKVLTLLRISAEEGKDLNELLEDLKKIQGFNQGKIEDYVFGVKIIKISYVCEDKAAVDYEELTQKVPGVGEVNVEEVGLIS